MAVTQKSLERIVGDEMTVVHQPSPGLRFEFTGFIHKAGDGFRVQSSGYSKDSYVEFMAGNVQELDLDEAYIQLGEIKRW
jgi:hypothetical protein|tara:strand:+ start:286 stop:525 length:240 start_codon:yes stop_codon:yes gene_type:complete